MRGRAASGRVLSRARLQPPQPHTDHARRMRVRTVAVRRRLLQRVHFRTGPLRQQLHCVQPDVMAGVCVGRGLCYAMRAQLPAQVLAQLHWFRGSRRRAVHQFVETAQKQERQLQCYCASGSWSERLLCDPRYKYM